MSFIECPAPEYHTETGPVELVIEPRERDLGAFSVRRLLPVARRRMVGPFIFFDHMGPAELAPGKGLDVRPHPHIGLATVTYLFEGEIMHRDSLGFELPIRPGAVNWMTAGRGIVHSERSGDRERAAASRLHGIQSWVALPLEHEDEEPSFTHYDADRLPRLDVDGVRMRLIAGSAFGERSPVATFSELHYLDAEFPAGGALTLDAALGERACHIVSGAIEVAGERHEAGRMLVFRNGAAVALRAPVASRVMLFGGAALEGERHIWWNFVASSKDRLEAAKRAWKDGRFPKVPGDDEFIPLPD
jgi:redox-sensitive bicupin YhaK (pirin superfamily)